jgi:hypothetical protein
VGDANNTAFPGNDIVGKKDSTFYAAGFVGCMNEQTASTGSAATQTGSGGSKTFSTRATTVPTTTPAVLIGITLQPGNYLISAIVQCNANGGGQTLSATVFVGATAVTNTFQNRVENISQGSVSFTLPLLVVSAITVTVVGNTSINNATVGVHEMWAIRI